MSQSSRLLFSRFIHEHRYFIRFQYCSYVPTVPKCRPNTDGIQIETFIQLILPWFSTILFPINNFIVVRAGLSSTENLLNRTLIRIILWVIAFFTLIGNSLVLLGRGILKDENKVPLNFIRSLAGSLQLIHDLVALEPFLLTDLFDLFYVLTVFYLPSSHLIAGDRVHSHTIIRSSGRHVDGLLPICHSHSGLTVSRSLSPVFASMDFVFGLHFCWRCGHDLNRGINDYISPLGDLIWRSAISPSVMHIRKNRAPPQKKKILFHCSILHSLLFILLF